MFIDTFDLLNADKILFLQIGSDFWKSFTANAGK